ncbi:MAG: hypothetical protein A2X36_01310 [Elusimicrobia bacterium GWA2_69_24]|nr:MAG: hypothetical protein A2X36_01310 [Elusimicrobia bacterium GWA2_69_24]HBL15255.1 hypothetical protein [Elusimicrobiota bacterium]
MTLPVFCAANLVLQLLLYSVLAWPMLGVLRPAVPLRDAAAFMAHAAALLLALGALWTAFLLFIERRLGPRSAKAAALGLESAAACLILIDSGTYLLLGLHAHDPIVSSAFLKLSGLNFGVPLGVRGLLSGLAALLTIAAAEWSLLRLSEKLVRSWPPTARERAGRGLPRRLAVYSILALSYLLLELNMNKGSIPRDALPLYSLYGAPLHEPPVLRARPPALGPGESSKLMRRPDILVVMVESLRGGMLTPETTPNIMRHLREGRCIVSENNFSGGHLTMHGIFSLLYGLDATRYASYIDGGTPAFPLRTLKDNGYELVAADASGVVSYEDSPAVLKQFDSYHPFIGSARREQDDERVIDWMRDFRSRRRKEVPFFGLLFLYSPHTRYYYPDSFGKFQPASGEGDYHLFFRGTPDAALRARLFNRYKNSVHYVDHLFQRLMVAYAEDIRSGKLIVAFLGDHGEEFWEHGTYGHAAPRFENERIQTPLFLCLPGIRSQTVPLSSHADVFPTIFDWAGLRAPATAYSDGTSLLGKARADGRIAAAGGGYPATGRDLCLITPERKYWLKLQPSKFDLFDLQRLTDLQDRPVPESEAEREELARQLAGLKEDILRFQR